MRYTNDIIEYVVNLGKEHTMEESLKFIQEKYPSLEITEEKLKEMEDRYCIQFRKKGFGIFTDSEVKAIKNLSQTCGNIKQVYDIYNEMYPSKCNYKDFLKEISQLDVMKMFNVTKDVEEFTPIDKEYVKLLIAEDKDDVSVFAKFNNVFPNKYTNEQFKKLLYNLKIEMGDTKIRYKHTPEEMKEAIDYIKSIEVDTVNNYVELLKKNTSVKRVDSNFIRNLIRRFGLPYKPDTNSPRLKAELPEFTNKDIILLKDIATRCSSICKMRDEFIKQSDNYKSIGLRKFGERLKKSGITPLVIPKRGKSKHIGSPVLRKGLGVIYEELVEIAKNRPLNEILEIVQNQHPEMQKVTSATLAQYMRRHNIEYLKNGPDYKSSKKVNEIDYNAIYNRLKELAPNHTMAECLPIICKEFNKNFSNAYIAQLVGRKGKLNFKTYNEFDAEMKAYVKSCLDEGVGIKEIQIRFSKKYPHKLTMATFYKCLNKLREEPTGIIVHNTAITSDLAATNKNTTEGFELSSENKTEAVNEVAEDDITRFMPIINEVNNTFERKCHQLNKEGDTHTHTSEVINALNVLLKYSDERKKLVRLTNDHEDILEQYRREVEHEIEIQPFSDTDTYPQNKLKVIGMRRREVKYVRDDLNAMTILLKLIEDNKEVFEKTLESLEHLKKTRDNSVFIPIVDVSMIDKYDWCKAGTLWSRKAQTPILKTNARIDRINNSKSQARNIWTEKDENINNFNPILETEENETNTSKSVHRISTYRVKAEFLVLKGNPFVNKYYDVKATSEESARVKGINYFDLISANNDNAQYQITDITRLNR